MFTNHAGWRHKQAIQSALDIGMHGIQVPNIDCVGDAELVVDYARHPPSGSRGFSPFTCWRLFYPTPNHL